MIKRVIAASALTLLTALTASNCQGAHSNTDPKYQTKSLKTSFSDGIWHGNITVKPGVYLTSKPTGKGCVWTLLDQYGSISSSDEPDPGSQVSVTIQQDDTFTTKKCGTWVLQS